MKGEIEMGLISWLNGLFGGESKKSEADKSQYDYFHGMTQKEKEAQASWVSPRERISEDVGRPSGEMDDELDERVNSGIYPD
jgi:hypothetical protein